MTTIPIFFTIDDKFAYYLECAVHSIMDHASADFCYRFIVLYEDLPQSHIDPILAEVQPPFEIEFVRMEKGFADITNRTENKLRCDFFTMTIFYRIFIAELFPQYDKGIYIDSDVIVPGDISELYQIDLGGNIIGACPDFSIQKEPEFIRYTEGAIGTPIEEYINSGVLLMNMKEMRDLHFSEHFLYLMNTWHFDSVAPDQDYINAMCRGKILFLDECWDAMPPQNHSRPLLENPSLIHYNLFQKPWCYDDIDYADVFWKYADASPFREEIRAYKANYSQEQKEADRAGIRRLLHKAGILADADVTFRKMMERGAKIRI